MAVLILFIFFSLSSVLCLTKRSKESLLVLLTCVALSLQWSAVLIFFAKKGGIDRGVQVFLFGIQNIRLYAQYLLIGINHLGYMMAVGRFLFVLFLIHLALFYCNTVPAFKRLWFKIAVSVLPILGLIAYHPNIFKILFHSQTHWLLYFVYFNQAWLLLYLVATLVLLCYAYRNISMFYYKKKFLKKCALLMSFMLLYALYLPQDPSQIYLFYRDIYLGFFQGFWYFNPALNLFNYVALYVVVICLFGVGFFALLNSVHHQLQKNMLYSEHQYKTDTATKGISIFTHALKNQILANKILLEELERNLENNVSKDKLLSLHHSLSQHNDVMLKRINELYNTIKFKTLVLNLEYLSVVLDEAKQLFLLKHPLGNISIQGSTHFRILCDKIHLSETLCNLFANAWEAQMKEDNQDPITVICHQEKLWIVLDVCDKGSGIPKKIKKKIFDPFFSTKNANYNWGMGLYYANDIIKKHFGVLRLETPKGKGSCFVVQLPRID